MRHAKRHRLDSILRPEDVPIGLRLEGFLGLHYRDEDDSGTDRTEFVIGARARFAAEIGNQANWPSVPQDRFNRRKDLCDAALA